jgi:hypothetical protein
MFTGQGYSRVVSGVNAVRLPELSGVLGAGVDLIPAVNLHPASDRQRLRAVLRFAVLVIDEPKATSSLDGDGAGVVHGGETRDRL